MKVGDIITNEQAETLEAGSVIEQEFAPTPSRGPAGALAKKQNPTFNVFMIGRMGQLYSVRGLVLDWEKVKLNFFDARWKIKYIYADT